MRTGNNEESSKGTFGIVGKIAMSVCGAACLLGFVLKNYHMAAIAFGVSFIVMGISFILSVKHPLDFPLLMSLSPVLGAVIAGVPLLDILDVSQITIDTHFILTVLTVSFLVFGISFLISPPINRMNKLRRCTQAVDAACVELNTSRSGGGVEMYCPVWEYYAGGSTYRYSSNVYSSSEKTKPGDTQQLMIDPSHPDDAFVETKAFNMISYIVGAVFTVAGAVLLIFLK